MAGWAACGGAIKGGQVSAPNSLQIPPVATESIASSSISDPSPTSAHTPILGAEHDRYIELKICFIILMLSTLQKIDHSVSEIKIRLKMYRIIKYIHLIKRFDNLH